MEISIGVTLASMKDNYRVTLNKPIVKFQKGLCI